MYLALLFQNGMIKIIIYKLATLIKKHMAKDKSNSTGDQQLPTPPPIPTPQEIAMAAQKIKDAKQQKIIDGLKAANEVLKEVRQIWRFPMSNLLHDAVVKNEKSMAFDKEDVPGALKNSYDILKRLDVEFKHAKLSPKVKRAIADIESLLEEYYYAGIESLLE
jgi:DNA polymerase III alpha subunit